MASGLTLRFPPGSPPFAAIAAASVGNILLDPSVDESLAPDSPAILTLSDGSHLRGASTILRYVARISQEAETQLYGNDAVTASQVDEWVDYSPVLSNGAEFERSCQYIDEFLALRTFLVGYDLTIADIAVWTRLAAAGQRWDSLVRSPAPRFPNLIRWFLSLSESSPSMGVSIAPFVINKKTGKRVPAANNHQAQEKEKGTTATSEGVAGGGVGGKGDAPPDLELPDAVFGEVVTRFPPEPSGFMHIGHAKAALMNQYFAQKYGGRLLIRFDDTNPSKEKDEFVESIMTDLATLGIQGERVTYTSDYFDKLLAMAEKLIREGKAYIDDTPKEQMRQERMDGIESANRSNSVEKNLELWKEMVAGSPRGLQCCLRGKMDMTAVNKTLRDPVYYRCNPVAHHRTGDKYKVYPTYDFACPFVDSLEGVTHALRSSEYHDRNEQFDRVIKDMGLRPVIVWDFSRLNFQYTLLSKRKLAWFVDSGRVDGWDDPRFPTVQGIMRRGLTVEALKQFIVSQGASKNLNLMEMDKLWTMNKKVIDPVCPRHTAVLAHQRVPFDLENGPETPFTRVIPRHKKYEGAGKKATLFARRVWLDQADAAAIAEGEEVTLMDWGNAIVQRVTREGDQGVVTTLTGVLHPEGSVKATKLKLTWLADSEELLPLTLLDYDCLITKKKLEEDEDFVSVLNPVTRWEAAALGDSNMRNIKKGEILQLERKGYFMCDAAYVRPTKPLVLIAIPDGRQRAPPGEYQPKF